MDSSNGYETIDRSDVVAASSTLSTDDLAGHGFASKSARLERRLGLILWGALVVLLILISL